MGISVRVAALCTVAVSIACSGDPVVGVLCPTSGDDSAYGRSVDNGIRLAVADATAAEAIPADLQILRYDTRSRADVAVTAFRRLATEERARLVIGGVTPEEVRALSPLADEHGVIFVSPIARPTTEGSDDPLVYRMFAGDEVEGATAARFLYEDRSVRRLILFTDNSGFSRGLETEFRQQYQLRLDGVVETTVHLREPEWETVAADALHGHRPAGVFIVGHAERILEVLRFLDARQFRGVRCTTSAFYVADVLDRAGEIAEGVFLPVFGFDPSAGEAAAGGFASRYRETYGGAPDLYAAHGYDAMGVVLRSLLLARDVTTKELRRVLSVRLRDFAGATGLLSFDEAGDVRRYPVMHVVWKGRIRPSAEVLRG